MYMYVYMYVYMYFVTARVTISQKLAKVHLVHLKVEHC